jgi:hypothetical protein
MKAREILQFAYLSEIMPSRLHGKAQHKTLQARIAEDIVALRERSRFFRTAPGRFFLREFLTDKAIPEQWRQPIATRRRFRDIYRGPALAIKANFLSTVAADGHKITAQSFFSALDTKAYRFVEPKCIQADEVLVRAFVCVHHDNQMLTYRVGRYRDDRDAFMQKRSIGFSSLVKDEEQTLFNLGSLGILDSGLTATLYDLDFPFTASAVDLSVELDHFVWVRDANEADGLLAVITFRCPTWFEPVKRRLALNDPTWLNPACPVNNVDDFDPWSRAVLGTSEGRL